MSLHDLIYDARRGDAEAVDSLCRYFHPAVASFVSRNMGAGVRRWTESGDVIQQVLVEVMRDLASLPEGAGEVELKKRLFRTAKSRITDAARRGQRHHGMSVLEEHDWDRSAEPPSNGPVTRADDRRFIEELAHRLPAVDSAVIKLCGLEGRSYVEASETLGISAEAVRKRYQRIRDALAAKLRNRNDGR